MAKPSGKGWIMLGEVGVDSGQLMVCDPCNIDGNWIPDQPSSPYPIEVLTEMGKVQFPSNKDWSWQFNNSGDTYATPQEALGGISVNQASRLGYVQSLQPPVKKEFSYRGCCDASRTDSYRVQSGLGGIDLAVCFGSGYGDGTYEVWGRKNKDGCIVEVRILMA